MKTPLPTRESVAWRQLSHQADLDECFGMQLRNADSSPGRVWLSNELVANLDERFSLTLQPNVIGHHRRDVAPGRSRCLQRDGEVLERHAHLRLGIVRQQSLGRRPDFPET